MQELKYFTPTLQDFRIGYEYEFHCMTIGGILYLEEETHKNIPPNIPQYCKQTYTGKIHRKGSMDAFDDCSLPPDFIIEALEKGSIRVPYLTKEQVIAEPGFIHEKEHSGDRGIVLKKDNLWYIFRPFEKDKYHLTVAPIDPSKEIDASHHMRFTGWCKCINTFRQICKLVNDKPNE